MTITELTIIYVIHFIFLLDNADLDKKIMIQRKLKYMVILKNIVLISAFIVIILSYWLELGTAHKIIF